MLDTAAGKSIGYFVYHSMYLCVSYDTRGIRKWHLFSNRGIHCAVRIESLNTCASQFESSLLRVKHFCFATGKGYRYKHLIVHDVGVHFALYGPQRLM